MIEEWRDIVGYEGEYQVSDMGRVRSLPGGRRHGKVLKLSPSGAPGNQYQHVGLPGRMTGVVHRLVAESFIGPCPLGKEVCHNNGNRLDNRPENLRYGTRSENILDTVQHGTSRASNTHCPSGHEFTEENTRHERVRSRNGGMVNRRVCRTCHREANRKFSRKAA